MTICMEAIPENNAYKHIKMGLKQHFTPIMAQGVGFEPTCLTANGFQVFEGASRNVPDRPRNAPIFRKIEPFSAR